MKNIFKLMGIALLSCSLMVACGKDDPEEPTPNPNPNPNPNPGQQSSITVSWDGANQAIGFTDAFQLSAGNTVYILEAAKGLNNDNYEWPLFRVGFDLDPNPQYGNALAAQWTYGEQQISGNSKFPTDAIIEGYYPSQNSYNQVMGDWQLFGPAQGDNYMLPDAQFDATTLTLSCNVAVILYSFTEALAEVEALGESATQQDIMNIVQNAEKKNMAVSIQNYKFDAASAQKAAMKKK